MKKTWEFGDPTLTLKANGDFVLVFFNFAFLPSFFSNEPSDYPYYITPLVLVKINYKKKDRRSKGRKCPCGSLAVLPSPRPLIRVRAWGVTGAAPPGDRRWCSRRPAVLLPRSDPSFVALPTSPIVLTPRTATMEERMKAVEG